MTHQELQALSDLISIMQKEGKTLITQDAMLKKQLFIDHYGNTLVYHDGAQVYASAQAWLAIREYDKITNQ